MRQSLHSTSPHQPFRRGCLCSLNEACSCVKFANCASSMRARFSQSGEQGLLILILVFALGSVQLVATGCAHAQVDAMRACASLMRRFCRKSILQGFGCSKAVRARVCELRGREKSRLCASALPPLRAEQSHCQSQSLSCSETGCCKLLQACARASWRAGEHAISIFLQCVGVVRWCVVPNKGASVRARSLLLKRALCTQFRRV